MSGSMMPQGGMAGGSPPQQQPQIPPQVLAMLMQAQQQRGVPQMPMGAPQQGMPPGGAPPGQPPMPPGAPQAAGGPPQPGGPPMPQGAPPMSQVPPMAMPQPPQMQRPPQMQQNLQAFGRMAQGAQGTHQPLMTPQEMAQLGRYGDQVIAHLTPGEIAVPPQVQTPQIKKDLAQAFKHAGVPPSNFVAGSPTSSVNPATGAPEYSLWASILPVLGAIGGAVAAPYTGGLSVPAGMALGGAAGGAAGGLIDHGSAAQIALQAAGGGAGGYLGGAMSGAGAAAGAGAGAAADAGPAITDTATAAAANPAGSLNASEATFGPQAFNASQFGMNPSALSSPALNSQTFADMVKNLPIKGAMTAGIGSSLGNVLAPQPTQDPAVPPGFNTPMAPLNKNWQAVRGNPGQVSTPQFAGYNPYTSVTSGTPYNFYPSAG